MKSKFGHYLHQGVSTLLIAGLFVSLLPSMVNAAQITNRKVTLGSSQPSVSTSHNYTFTVPSATTVQSVDFLYCTTPSGTCNLPSGLTTTTAALNGTPGNLGSGGTWAIGGTPTNGRIQIANASNTGSPTAGVTVNFNTITNPSISGNNQNTFYVRMVTYSDAAWTTPIDAGVVAGSVTNQIQVTASVDETLNFCAFQTGTTCVNGSGTTVALGTLSSSAATSGTSKLVAGTNASSGYVIQYVGTTLTSNGNTIAATGTTGATSSTGTSQFGINLVSNTTPSVGAAASGGTGAASTNYDTANTFSFAPSSLTQVAAAGAASADTLYTVAYLANISAAQPAGAYATTLTYICTATF